MLTFWWVQDIAASWQELTRDGFWRKFSTDQGPMAYTAICNVLKTERMHADHLRAEQAKAAYDQDFDSTFKYRKGGEHLVRKTDSAIARHFEALQG